MSTFGLTPDEILARSPATATRPLPTLAGSIGFGALAFAAVSVLAYAIWAYRLVAREPVMYAAIAAVYIALTGFALSRLVATGARGRFVALFAVAFAVYALAWCAFWFGLKGKLHADLWGSFVGLALMTLLLQRGFGVRDDFLAGFAVLFLFHTIGYYLGDVLYGLVRGATGRLLWGAAHGLGFGAGIGGLLFRCQQPLRLRLRPPASA